MPLIAPTNDPATALNGLGSMMFGDPSRLAQAQYAGAHARNMEAQTGQLQRQSYARDQVGQALSAAVANPNQQTIGAAISTALAAGYDPAQVVRGALAAHQAAGSPGGPQMAKNLVDTIQSTVGGTPFANTQTGFGQELQNRRDVATIGIQPGMAQVGLNRDVANNNRVFVDQSGNRIVVPMGQPIPAGAMPEDTSRAFGTANIGIQPAMEQQRRETQRYQDTPQAYTDPNTGQTYYRRPGGPLPASNAMPIQEAAPVLSSTITSEAARVQQARETARWQDTPQVSVDPFTGDTSTRQPGGPMPPPGFLPAQQGAPALSNIITTPPRPGLTPDPTSNSGYTPSWFGPGQVPPTGTLPIDPQSPQNTVGMGALFGSRAPASGAQAPLPQAQGAPTGDVSVRLGLGGVIAPASSSSAAPAFATPATPAPPDAGAAPGAQTPPTGPDRLKPMANRLMSGLPLGTPEVIPPGAHQAITKQIGASLAAYNQEKLKGAHMSDPMALDADAQGRIYDRAAELARDTTNRRTFNNYPNAVAQAWAEFAPQFIENRNWGLPGSGAATISLPPAPRQGGDTGPVPSAGPPTSSPANTGPTHQEAVPAPGNLPRTGNSAPTMSSILSQEPGTPMVGPQPAQTAQTAQTAQAGAPPAPANPAARQVGTLYTVPNGQQLMWTGQGWTK